MLNLDAVQKAQVSMSYYSKIKQGFDVTNEMGEHIPNSKITFDPEMPKSYAFCSDTAYEPGIIPLIKNASLLYHEATFLDEHQDLATKTKHSTAKEAARIAKDANVDTLLLGHYSGRYSDLEAFRVEAQEIFPNIELADDGKTFTI